MPRIISAFEINAEIVLHWHENCNIITYGLLFLIMNIVILFSYRINLSDKRII